MAGGDRIWPGGGGANIIKIDIWPLPGPLGPTLRPRHFWIHFGSLLEDRFGIHFCVTFGLSLDLSWRTGSGSISSSFWRRFEDPLSDVL